MSDIKIKSVNGDNIGDAVRVFNSFAGKLPHWFPVDAAALREYVLDGARTLYDVPFPFEPDACLVGYADGKPRGFIHAGVAPRLGPKEHEERTKGANAVIRCFLFDESYSHLGREMLDKVLVFFGSQEPKRTIAFEGELGYPNMSGGAGYCPVGLGHVISLLESRRFGESFRFTWYERALEKQVPPEFLPGITIRREKERRASGDMLKYTLSRDEEDTSVCYVALMRELAGEPGEGQAYIYNNTTFPGQRRKGYAGLTMRYVLADLDEFAINRLFILVPVDNLAARKLYEKSGFTPGEECIEMEMP
jgi:ribosomal protein S18 acetylase RimI-like enzyme